MKAATDLQEQAIEEISKDVEDLLSHAVNGQQRDMRQKIAPLPLLMAYITGRWTMLFVFYRDFSYYIPSL